MNLIPGFIKSYNAGARLARVEIPGVTDGCEVYPEAEFLYPFGDKSEHTEIHVIIGDRVWLGFNNGDARFPVILGYRPKAIDNSTTYRRWHHANVEIEAFDGHVKVTASVKVDVIAPIVNVIAPVVNVTANSQVNITSPLIVATGTIRAYGDIIAGYSAANISLLTHRTTGVQSGGGISSTPIA